MNRQALFDRHVAALATCTEQTWDEYTLLEAAAKVRSLLIDGSSSLVHQVNRQRRKRIVFKVKGETEYERMVLSDGPTFYAKTVGIHPPSALVQSPVVRFGLDDFLKYRVAHVNGQDVSVREVVLYLANVAGGVHAGSPKSIVAGDIDAMDTSLHIGGTGSVAGTMQGIAMVVVDALQPLVTPTYDVRESDRTNWHRDFRRDSGG